jgi:transposase InsO family protein
LPLRVACLQRQGISRLPDVEGSKASKKNFKIYPIGFFHIDIAEVQTAEGKLYLYVAIDRTSKFAFVQLVKKTGRTSASAFLEALIAAAPYKIRTVLTDNGIQFTFPPRYADGPTAKYMTHMFDMRWRHDQLETHLSDFINAYNYSRRLKTLKGLTPFEYISKIWTEDPNRFKLNPLHQMPGLNF